MIPSAIVDAPCRRRGRSCDQQRPQLVGDPAELGEVRRRARRPRWAGMRERAQVAVLVAAARTPRGARRGRTRAAAPGRARGSRVDSSSSWKRLVGGVERRGRRRARRRTSNSGSIPASTGRSRSSAVGEAVDRLDVAAVQVARRRLHAARAPRPSPRPARRSSASRTRVESSAAAFSVNVITTSSIDGRRRRVASTLVTRSTSTVVLPGAGAGLDAEV